MRDGHDLLTGSDVISRTPDPARERARLSPIVWLNLLCLDAPIVAVTWQWLFARNFHVSLHAPSRVALFLTAWFIYLADRFGDTLSLPRENSRSLRQRFCERHRRAWIALLALTGFFDSWLIIRYLDARIFFLGVGIGLLSLLYLATNYWLGKVWRVLPIKEICIGALFSVGTVAALLPKMERWSGSFLLSFFLFAALCSLNCISIAVWERTLDQTQGKNSLATRWPRVCSHLKSSALVLAGACVLVAIGSRTSAEVCGFIGASALLLGLLDLGHDVIPPDERTALADLVLLTPLSLLLFQFLA